MTNKDDVLVSEVGPRDGLQSINTVFSTKEKMQWIKREAEAGVAKIQVGSFVPPKLLPQLADTADVVNQSIQIPGLTVAALVPNMKGAENGMAAGTHQIGVVMSVSEAHNQANVRRSTQQSIDQFAEIIAFRNAHLEYKDIVISGGIYDVLRVAEELLKRGAQRLNVADTVGYADPKQVRDLFTELYRAIGDDIPVSAHFHDTRGLGLANVFAALDAGVREFEACLGGLGGCPYAPGASGNIVTEDLAFMLEAMGLSTGVDLEGLLETREIMERHLNGEPTHGTFAKAGRPKGFVIKPAIF